MKDHATNLLLVVDLSGTILFGIEGATAAITSNLDLLGLLVLGFATALAGGIIRDLLIGAVPPSSLRDWRYAAMAFLGAAMVFLFHHLIQEVPSGVILILDAAGLGLFSVAGTEKALDHRMHPFIAILLGTITGVGGGTLRDILLAKIPMVLRADIYATAAMAGAAAMIIGRRLGLPPAWAATLGGVTCFALRVVSVWQHWNLPKVMLS